MGQSLRRVARKQDERASDALGRFAHLPLRRIAHTGLLDRAWQLRHNFSFYDALYIALAEALGTSLLTLDARLARAAGSATAVEVLTPF